MSDESEVFYRALESRDARFDGRFFTGVKTTGIYCRPICPARTPKRANVQFFPCAAAAEAAGFRPCRRCRPETAPGSPGWLGTSATVSRGLRLIAEGALDDDGVDAMAARLGIGSRHLRRLFQEHLGTSPLVIAQTRRTHFARQLIDQTTLPMIRVSQEAGFASVRRFNAAIRAAFDRTPSELRRRAASRRPSLDEAKLALKLPYRPPLEWAAMLRFFSSRATPGVEEVDRDTYRRTIAIGEFAGVMEVTSVPGTTQLVLSVPRGASSNLMQIVNRVRRLFDLDADPLAISEQIGQDRLLRPLLAARPGLRVPGAWDAFELAVRAILGQQVSVPAATTLAGRVVARFGTPLDDQPSNGPSHLFPTGEQLADADFGGLGIVPQRADTIRRVAQAVCDGQITLDATQGTDEFTARLTTISGIGPWTAQYIAMRAFGEPDAFPAGDLGLRRAATTNGRPLSERQMAERAQRWRPWRAYGAMHLWNAATPRTVRHRRLRHAIGVG